MTRLVLALLLAGFGASTTHTTAMPRGEGGTATVARFGAVDAPGCSSSEDC